MPGKAAGPAAAVADDVPVRRRVRGRPLWTPREAGRASTTCSTTCSGARRAEIAGAIHDRHKYNATRCGGGAARPDRPVEDGNCGRAAGQLAGLGLGIACPALPGSARLPRDLAPTCVWRGMAKGQPFPACARAGCIGPEDSLVLSNRLSGTRPRLISSRLATLVAIHGAVGGWPLYADRLWASEAGWEGSRTAVRLGPVRYHSSTQGPGAAQGTPGKASGSASLPLPGLVSGRRAVTPVSPCWHPSTGGGVSAACVRVRRLYPPHRRISVRRKFRESCRFIDRSVVPSVASWRGGGQGGRDTPRRRDSASSPLTCLRAAPPPATPRQRSSASSAWH